MKKNLSPKWVIDFRIYACSCGLAFWSHKHFIEHLKNSKKYKEYHYAQDGTSNNGRTNTFLLTLCHKNGKNINEAFME